MSDTAIDPKSILDSYRSAFAPLLKAQQEGVKLLDRVGRYQYAVAGDYLEWSLAEAKLAIAAHTPADFLSKQVELATGLSEKIRGRVQELSTLATESQATFTDAVKEISTKVAEETKKFEEKKFEEPKRKAG